MGVGEGVIVAVGVEVGDMAVGVREAGGGFNDEQAASPRRKEQIKKPRR